MFVCVSLKCTWISVNNQQKQEWINYHGDVIWPVSSCSGWFLCGVFILSSYLENYTHQLSLFLCTVESWCLCWRRIWTCPVEGRPVNPSWGHSKPLSTSSNSSSAPGCSTLSKFVWLILKLRNYERSQLNQKHPKGHTDPLKNENMKTCLKNDIMKTIGKRYSVMWPLHQSFDWSVFSWTARCSCWLCSEYLHTAEYAVCSI